MRKLANEVEQYQEEGVTGWDICRLWRRKAALSLSTAGVSPLISFLLSVSDLGELLLAR
jgi:hypothetical protein